MPAQDTIYALATGIGRSAIAIIRISGDRAHLVVERLTRSILPEPRCLVRRQLVSRTGDEIDDAMVVLFSEGKSVTGEQMAEIHCHGGRAVISAVMNEIGAVEHLRLAEPGEFTRRSFLNGNMDLSAVEGLSDLISAETELQRKQAMRISNGALASRVSGWRDLLIKARGLVELTIDWADEEVPEDVTDEVRDILGHLAGDLQAELRHSESTEKLRSGFEVAIVGPPNVGKSSLLNALAGREAAITSDTPGTTRDVLELPYDLDGLPVRFLDTAGLRETVDAVEEEGVRRALTRADAADLRIHLRCETDRGAGQFSALKQDHDLTVWSKADICEGPADIHISVKTGQGIEDLLREISHRLSEGAESFGLLGHHRQQQHVQCALRALQKGREGLGTADLEVIAEDLRAATSELERLVGRVDVEDVLGSVFSSFCLGK